MSAPARSETEHRCAPWTRAQGADPIGSALTCDTLVLIETPPPWPRDVGELPAFAELLQRGYRRTRLLAVRPAEGRAAGSVGVTLWRRSADGGMAGTDHLLPAGRLAEAVAGLVEHPERAAAEGAPAPPEVLICGHGARDACCGRLGTRLALDAGAETGAVGGATVSAGAAVAAGAVETGAAAGTGGCGSVGSAVRVRRCSHTGGHRFAPTGLTLPDGRAWGFLDEETLDAIVHRRGAPPLRGHYRGSLELDMWAQVAERALFERHGWGWLEHRLTSVRTEPAADGRSAVVALRWQGPSGEGAAVATVGIARDLPVLVCGSPPEEARKTSPELVLRSFDHA
ncbi:sucrase ferredoxin [Phaeacidiphilus oryzae]|uniref:sucrase ferredoxin n=1 Tax=Phaeacidiphilus oryzae TaxID=348818 RepID=UPI000559D8CC|nr:sucrase ferredoxin [Phaeacidiphilus oryzae]